MGTDPSSGYPYYANLHTGETQWHPPQPAAAVAPPPPPPPAEPALPAGWVKATDPNSGHVYYTNPTTGASQWTPPLPPPTLTPVATAPRYAPVETGVGVAVKGLPASMSEADVKELFSSCGRILRVALERDAYSAGTHPKSGTVVFDQKASALEAVKQMDGIKMRAHTLKVELKDGDARPKPY